METALEDEEDDWGKSDGEEQEDGDFEGYIHVVDDDLEDVDAWKKDEEDEDDEESEASESDR